jgi:hypothetical protein
VAALAAAGCGGSDFEGKANKLCKTYSAKVKAVHNPRNQASSIATYLSQVAALTEEGTAKLRALKPPSDKKSAYDAFLSSLDQETAVARQAERTAKGGDAKAAVAQVQQVSEINKQVDAHAKDAGLKECAKD